MANYSVSDGANPDTDEQVFFMESASPDIVQLSMPKKLIRISPDKAEEIRALLAIVIAEARERPQP